jgi:hypothetical protein
MFKKKKSNFIGNLVKENMVSLATTGHSLSKRLGKKQLPMDSCPVVWLKMKRNINLMQMGFPSSYTYKYFQAPTDKPRQHVLQKESPHAAALIDPRGQFSKHIPHVTCYEMNSPSTKELIMELLRGLM